MKYFSKRRGFTLIELVVVIAIIAILTAIVTSNFTQSKAKARDAKRVSDLANIQLTLGMVFDRCNQYPTSISNIDTDVCPNYPIKYFMSVMPKDSDGTEYIYAVDNTTKPKDYILKASFEEKSSALTDAYTGSPSSPYFINGDPGKQEDVPCSERTTPRYDYCVVPK